MNRKSKQRRKRSILIKIFGVILALTISFFLFIMAFWGIFLNKPNQLYAHIHLAITLVILIVVGAMVASFMIRKILKPLTALNEAVEKAGKGDLDQHIPDSSNDELGSLAKAFNQMTADLKKMIVAREQLLLDVSHELRSPITRAKLALEMMPDSPAKGCLESDLKEMEMMITEILESERLKNGAIVPNFTRVQVKSLLEKVMENYRRDNNRITLFPVSDDITVNIDEGLIMTVLRNVLDNSLKYSSAQSKPVEINVIRHNRQITIQIEDFGQGIPEDKVPYVFEPFYRADESRSRKTGGYGLGLHLCKRIMDLHHADIVLKNKTNSSGVIVNLIFKDIAV
ncbi:MAG TPA: HAMP domain-containing sensor histidine kinase [Bacteroidales bacterium]